MRILVKKSKSKSVAEPIDKKLAKAKDELLAINAHREDTTWLLNKFQSVFNYLPLTKPTTLVFMKLSYHYFKESTPPELWKTKNENTLRNYNAAMEMNLLKFSEALRSILTAEIKGDIQMAKTVATKKVGEKKEMSAEQKKVFSPVKGKTLGLGIVATWVHLFKENKLTDSLMDAFMQKEYPSRNVGSTEAARKKYNKGVLTKGIIPKPLSTSKGGSVKKKEPAKPKVKVSVK